MKKEWIPNIVVGVIVGVISTWMINEPLLLNQTRGSFLVENCTNYLTAYIARENYEQPTEIKKRFSTQFYNTENPMIQKLLTAHERKSFNALVFNLETANRTIEKYDYLYSEELNAAAKNIIKIFHDLGIEKSECYRQTGHYLLKS